MPTTTKDNLPLTQPSSEDSSEESPAKTNPSGHSLSSIFSTEMLNPRSPTPPKKRASKKTRREKLVSKLESHRAAAAHCEEVMDTAEDTDILLDAKILRNAELEAAQDTESEISEIDSSSSDDDETEDKPNPDNEPPTAPSQKPSQKYTNQPSSKQKPKSQPSQMKLRSASDIHKKKTPFDPSIVQANKNKKSEINDLNKKLKQLYSPVQHPQVESHPTSTANLEHDLFRATEKGIATSSKRMTRSSGKNEPQSKTTSPTVLQKDDYPIRKQSSTPTTTNNPPGKGLTSSEVKIKYGGVKSLAEMFPDYSNDHEQKSPTPKTPKKKTQTKSRPSSPKPSTTKPKANAQKKTVSPPPTQKKPRDPTPTRNEARNNKTTRKPKQASRPALPEDLIPSPKKRLQQRADSMLTEPLEGSPEWMLQEHLAGLNDLDTIPDQKYLRQSQLEYHQASYKPPSPKPNLSKTNPNDDDEEEPSTKHPTRPNQNHPDLSHKTQNPRTTHRPAIFTPPREQILDIRPTGEVTAHVQTPSVNCLPTGTNVITKSNTKLTLDKFCHLFHEQFVIDPYKFRPAELLSMTTHNASDGFALNSLQWWFEHPHHAMISYATGTKGRGVLLHTPSVFTIPPSLCEDEDTREITAVQGSQNVAKLLSIDSTLNMFQLVQARAPTPSYFASYGFSNIDDHCPEWQRETTNLCPSIALPAHIATAITEAGNSTSARDVFNVIMGIIHKEYRESLRGTGHEPSILSLSKRGKPILPGEEPCLNIDEDFLWISEKYHHILALCWVAHRHSIPAIPNQFVHTPNPTARAWMLKFTDWIKKGKGDYSSVLQDPSRLQNKTIARLKGTPKLPLFPNRTRFKQTSMRAYLPTIDEISDTDTPPELPPENLFPSLHRQGTNYKPDECQPYDWFYPEEKKDDPPNDWSQIRGPGSKRPAKLSNLTPRQQDHVKRTRVEIPNHMDEVFEAESYRPNTPPPQCSPMYTEYADNTRELNSPNADKASREDYANALRPTSNSSTAKLIEILTKSVERQTKIQQKTLEQNEKHFEARENRSISTATRITHQNCSTIDGKNPATELTELDSDLLKCKNAFDGKDRIELFLRTNGCTTVITLELTKALIRGRWMPDNRFTPQGWSMFQAIASPLQAMDEIRGSELERAHDDYKLNKKITPQQQEALMDTRICIPRQMHYLSDQIKIMYYLTVGLTGPESKLTEFMLLWWNFVDTNKQLLIDLQLNGHKLLPVQIAHQIEQTRITYLTEGQSKVPDASILNSEQMMGLILGGNHQITICRSIMNHIENTNGRKHPNKNRYDQPSDNDPPNPNGQRGRPVSHLHQPPQLRVTRSTYRNALMPALRNREITMPEHNNMEECAKFCFLGQCHDQCPRNRNHTQVLNGSTRAKALTKSLEQAQHWYQSNKNPGAPDFQ